MVRATHKQVTQFAAQLGLDVETNRPGDGRIRYTFRDLDSRQSYYCNGSANAVLFLSGVLWQRSNLAIASLYSRS